MNINKKAMTLPEAVFTVAFFSFVMGACLLMSKVGWDSWQINSSRVEIIGQLRQVSGRLGLDLRQAGVSTISDVPADGNWYHAITFQIPQTVDAGAVVWMPAIRYALDDVNPSILNRTSDGTTVPVANLITEFNVRRLLLTPNVLEIQVKAEKRTSRSNEVLDYTIVMNITLRIS